MIDIPNTGARTIPIKRNRGTGGRSLLTKINERFTGTSASGAANGKVLPGRASMIDIEPMEIVQEDEVDVASTEQSPSAAAMIHEGHATAPLAVANGVRSRQLGIRGSKLYGNDASESFHSTNALASLFGTTSNSLPSSERDVEGDHLSGKESSAGDDDKNKPTRPTSTLTSLFATAEISSQKSQTQDHLLSEKSRPKSAVVSRAPSAKLRRPASAQARDSPLPFTSDSGKDRMDSIMRPSSAVSVSETNALVRPSSTLASLFDTMEFPSDSSQREDMISEKDRPISAVISRAPSAKLRRPVSAIAKEPPTTAPYTSPHSTTISSLLNVISPRPPLASPPTSSSPLEALFANDVEEAIPSTTTTASQPRALSAKPTPTIATSTAATATPSNSNNLLSSLFGMFSSRKESLLPSITSVKEELSPASPAMNDLADQLFQDDDEESITSLPQRSGGGPSHTAHSVAESRTEIRRAPLQRSSKQSDTVTQTGTTIPLPRTYLI